MNAPKPPKTSKKTSKPLTIQQRVDLLLREGVDRPEKWAAVHGYEELEEAVVGDDAWQDEYWRLRKHHLEETEFLFSVIRELKERHERLQERWDNACDEAAERDLID